VDLLEIHEGAFRPRETQRGKQTPSHTTERVVFLFLRCSTDVMSCPCASDNDTEAHLHLMANYAVAVHYSL
jgi:hypothetical protein